MIISQCYIKHPKFYSCETIQQKCLKCVIKLLTQHNHSLSHPPWINFLNNVSRFLNLKKPSKYITIFIY